jgi:hypothetical protein
MRWMLYLPRLFVYHCAAEKGRGQLERQSFGCNSRGIVCLRSSRAGLSIGKHRDYSLWSWC